MEKIITIMMGISLIINGILVLYIAVTHARIKGLLVQNKSNEQQIQDWREKLLEKVKEQIAITEKSEQLIKKGQDYVAEFIYQQNDIKKLGENLSEIFSMQLSSLKDQFPALTDLDLLVICLLGIGMDNYEISTILRMEKRTLYRRRQLIAMRIGISSLQLDEFAMNIVSKQ